MISDLPRRLAVLTFAAAITVGNFHIPGVDALALQARFPLTLICGAAALFIAFPARPARSTIAAALLVSALLAFLALHAAMFGAVDFRSRYLIDLAHTAVLIWLCVFLIRDAVDLETFCVALVVAGIALIPVWWSGHAPFGPITFYRVEFMAFAAATFLWLRGEKRLASLAPVFLFCAVASKSKAAMFCAPVAIAYGCFLLAALERPWLRIAINSAAAMLAFGLIFATPAMQRIMAAAPTTTYQVADATAQVTTTVAASAVAAPPMVGNVTTVGDGSQRLQMALHAIRLVTERPLRGAGIGSFDVIANSSDGSGIVEHYRYPHNVTFEVLYSTGVPGLVAFMATAIILLVRLHRQMIRDHAVIAIGIGAAFILLTAQFSGDLYDLRIFWILLIPAWTRSARTAGNHDRLARDDRLLTFVH